MREQPSPQRIEPSQAQAEAFGAEVSKAIVEGMNQKFPPKPIAPSKAHAEAVADKFSKAIVEGMNRKFPPKKKKT